MLIKNNQEQLNRIEFIDHKEVLDPAVLDAPPEREQVAMGIRSRKITSHSLPAGANPMILQAQVEGLRLQKKKIQSFLDVLTNEEQRVLALLEKLPDPMSMPVTLGMDFGVQLPAATGLTKTGRPRRQFSEESRAKIREAQAKRWAAKREAAAEAGEIKMAPETPPMTESIVPVPAEPEPTAPTKSKNPTKSKKK
jgi:hypothetical protein